MGSRQGKGLSGPPLDTQCRTPRLAQVIPSRGSRLGPYEILAPLGRGGMGEVYRARDTRLGREVAIKVIASGVIVDAERTRRPRSSSLS